MFISYVDHNDAYRFLVLRSEILNCNTMIDMKNVEFFENIFSLSKIYFYTYLDKCVYTKLVNGECMIISLYVNDLLISKDFLAFKFDMKDIVYDH